MRLLLNEEVEILKNGFKLVSKTLPLKENMLKRLTFREQLQ